MKYVRAATAGIIAALAVWLMGMFISWDAYGFWQHGNWFFDVAAVTRMVMLWAFCGSASLWFAAREDKA